MLEIKRTAIAFEQEELLALEQIIIDHDEREALKFLKESVYDKIVSSQQGKLKSHLDTG
jgi:hypothetical protein